MRRSRSARRTAASTGRGVARARPRRAAAALELLHGLPVRAQRRGPSRPPPARAGPSLRSPAASAWWASRAGSAAGQRAGRPGSGGAGRSGAAGAPASTTVSRASSCRNIRRRRRQLQHAGTERLVERGLAARRHLVDHGELGARPASATTSRLSRAAGREPGRPRQHGVADAAGHRAAAGRDHLGDVEGVAAGLLVQLVGSTVPAAPTSRRTASAVSGARSMRRTRRAGHVAEHQPERVLAGRLLGAVGDQHQRAQPMHAAGQVPDQVERRVVGPVRVLDHEEERWPAGRAAPR